MDKKTNVSCCLCGADNAKYLYQSYKGDDYVECNVCGLVYQNPRVTTPYDNTYWESPIDPDGRTRHLLEERETKIKTQYSWDVKQIHKFSPGRILDVGCGPGFFLSAISNAWEKHGTDVSEFATNYARRHLPNATIFTGELQEAGYPSEYFDVVYCFEVLEHIDNPLVMVKEIQRVTKPGGLVVFSTPNIESFVAKRFKWNFRLLGTPHIVLWSKATLSMLLMTNGLEPFRIHYPYFGTKYFTLRNLLRLWDTNKVSPPFYGNDMIIHSRRI